jgi:cobalt-zinc-cadmium efflux system protein
MGVLATWQLAEANRQSMNIEGSFQHILTDLIAVIATAIASAVILATDWTPADGRGRALRRSGHAALRLGAAVRLGPRPARRQRRKG